MDGYRYFYFGSNVINDSLADARFFDKSCLSLNFGGFWGRDLTKVVVITYILSNVHPIYMYIVSTSRRYVDMVI